jgi:hypothetical protein
MTTFQTPEVIEKGSRVVGAGLSASLNTGDPKILMPAFECYARKGLAKKTDGGLKIFGLPCGFGGIVADIKYHLFDGPISVSGDLGASVSAIKVEDYQWTFALYPMIIAGTDRAYVGVRSSYVGIWGFGHIPGVFVGGSLGDTFRIMPEVSYHFIGDEDDGFFTFGLGFQSQPH